MKKLKVAIDFSEIDWENARNVKLDMPFLSKPLLVGIGINSGNVYAISKSTMVNVYYELEVFTSAGEFVHDAPLSNTLPEAKKRAEDIEAYGIDK